jgi:hypothetical protein
VKQSGQISAVIGKSADGRNLGLTRRQPRDRDFMIRRMPAHVSGYGKRTTVLISQKSQVTV